MLEMKKQTYSTLGWLGAVWGLLGFTILLVNAFERLVPYALDMFNYPLGWLEIGTLIIWTVFMAISEGYRGFQKAFSPRFAARARWLRSHPKPLFVLLAPLFCMGFMGSTKKRKIVIWCLTLGIITLVILIRYLAQPWRGIIDTGVVVGLGWGLSSVIWCMGQALLKDDYPVDPEIG